MSFYREAFGWPVRVDVPVYVEFVLPDGRGLGVYERKSFGVNTGVAPDLPPPGSLTGTELYFRTDDPAAAVDRLLGAGARLLSELAPRTWLDEVAYLADPDGHVIAVARHHDEEE